MTTARPTYGTPEWNAIYDAKRKILGYPSREETAEFDRRFPILGTAPAKPAQPSEPDQ